MWLETLEILSVVLLASVEILAAIPAGFAFGHHYLLIIAETSLGAILGAVIIIKFGDGLRKWLLKRKKEKKEPSPRRQRFKRIYEKYGVVGTGLLAPLITGVPLGAAMSVAAGASPANNIHWTAIGVLIWTTIFTLLGELGIEIFG
jgi:membrane protein DedA with SNARE-associated domain